ncbi:hypothetical protein VNO80_16135 [Phaseolus coccineus]|uniref:F-box domain-containing protein n=1 Tax=Phaseolus coccineus TaxID=3886 RepID=A0AAN9QZU0_PHACN
MDSPKRRRDGSVGDGAGAGAGAGVAATSASPTMPDDLVMEILSRIPVKALMRFRCVSKYWNSFVFDPNLVKLHLQRSPRDNPILYTLSEYGEYGQYDEYDDAHFLHCSSTHRLLQNPQSVVGNRGDAIPVFVDYDIVGVCNGLVCLSRIHNNLDEIWVRFWNPATRLSSNESPSCYIEGGCANMAFGYDASTDTYKVVAAVMSDAKSHKMELRVHNLGDDCWREIPTSDADFPTEFCQTKGVFLNGTLNWVADLGTGNSPLFVDFSFDVANETYTCFKLPDDVGEGFSELGVFGGCLCLSHIYHRESFAFWQMKEFGVHESWTLLMNISYDYFEFPRYLIPRPLCLSEDGNILILVCHAEYQLVWCNRRDLLIQHFEIPHKWISLKSTDYVQSLVLPYRTT